MSSNVSMIDGHDDAVEQGKNRAFYFMEDPTKETLKELLQLSELDHAIIRAGNELRKTYELACVLRDSNKKEETK